MNEKELLKDLEFVKFKMDERDFDNAYEHLDFIIGEVRRMK